MLLDDSYPPRQPYSVGIIGCGGIGYRLDRAWHGHGARTHFHAFHASPHFRIAGVAEPDDRTRAEIRRDYGVPAYASHLDLLRDASCDVVAVASPDATHAPILRDLLASGARMVFCEKPVATRLDEIEDLVDAYESARVGLAVNYSRRFLTAFDLVRARIASGALGRLQSVLIYYSRGFVHNAPHYLDLLLWWFGVPEEVLVEGRRRGLAEEDPTLSVFMRYADGLEVRLVGMESSDVLINEIDVIGTEGRIEMETTGHVVISRAEAMPDYPAFRYYAPVERVRADLAEAMPNAVRNISRWLAGTETLSTPARDSLAVHRLMHQITTQSR